MASADRCSAKRLPIQRMAALFFAASFASRSPDVIRRMMVLMKAAEIPYMLVLLVSLTAPPRLPAAGTFIVNWSALESAVVAYLRHPGISSADRVLTLLPAGPTVSREGKDFDDAAAERLWRYSLDLAPLVRRVQPGALDVAWALRAIADGAFLDDLNAMIAKPLAGHPRAFLLALKRHRLRTDEADACAVAASLGVDVVDRPSAQRMELHARIAALETMTDPVLTRERACALNALRSKGEDATD
jgi:hypothetical protein